MIRIIRCAPGAFEGANEFRSPSAAGEKTISGTVRPSAACGAFFCPLWPNRNTEAGIPSL
jgi:hypothetical protein